MNDHSRSAPADAALGSIERSSTAERVAAVLRERIIEGYFRSGTRLREESLKEALDVSRNTLREAFRLLAHRRLVVHRLNQGVFVREATAEDVADIYRTRRLLECAAVREVTPSSPALRQAAQALADAEKAAENQDWDQVATADVRFHQAITALAGSRRVDELMATIGAELRLVFHTMTDTPTFHEPYLDRNRQILKTLQAGDGPGAERLLVSYLEDAESVLLQCLNQPPTFT
jgi:DNA-binding GntR family transcriptional regulator